MSTLTDALAQLRRDNPPMSMTPCSTPCSPGCCIEPTERTNVVISDMVGHLVLDALGSEWVDFGTFDNCREYGLTFTVPGWQFCVYEHRNSDEICIQGCPIDEIAGDYGPWPGDITKWDVLAKASYEMYGAAAVYLIEALRYVNKNPKATRREVKSALAEAAMSR